MSLRCRAQLASSALLRAKLAVSMTKQSSPLEKHLTDRLFICRLSDVPLGGAIRIEIGELVPAVFNLDRAIFVTDDACTHGPGSLSEGYIEDDIVECNFHHGAFNVRTGGHASPPCMRPIRMYAVKVSHGSVFIDRNRQLSNETQSAARHHVEG
jgi:nitrite reductase/ring-hydroxylating ferredoxin subunit